MCIYMYLCVDGVYRYILKKYRKPGAQDATYAQVRTKHWDVAKRHETCGQKQSQFWAVPFEPRLELDWRGWHISQQHEPCQKEITRTNVPQMQPE